MHGKGGTLTIEPLRDQIAARHLHGSVQHLAAKLLGDPHRLLRIGDVDVGQPRRRSRPLRGLRVHPADHPAFPAKHLIGALGAHVHRFGLFPPEEALVERQRRTPVGRGQLVPREVSNPRLRVRGHVLEAFERGEGSALRVLDHGESADCRNIGRCLEDGRPERRRLFRGFVDIGRTDVAQPARRCAHFSRILWQDHQSGHRTGARHEHAVRLVPQLGFPPDKLRVKLRG